MDVFVDVRCGERIVVDGERESGGKKRREEDVLGRLQTFRPFSPLTEVLFSSETTTSTRRCSFFFQGNTARHPFLEKLSRSSATLTRSSNVERFFPPSKIMLRLLPPRRALLAWAGSLLLLGTRFPTFSPWCAEAMRIGKEIREKFSQDDEARDDHDTAGASSAGDHDSETSTEDENGDSFYQERDWNEEEEEEAEEGEIEPLYPDHEDEDQQSTERIQAADSEDLLEYHEDDGDEDDVRILFKKIIHHRN